MKTKSDWCKEIDRLLAPSKSKAGRGRKRTVDEREIVNAVLYWSRSGCPWELLPHDFPDYKTVYSYFRSWQRKGVWERIHAQLTTKVRLQEGKQETATAAIIDSQSVKTSESGGNERGFEGGKRIKEGCQLNLEVVKRQSKQFEILPRRWVVERTFAWLGKQRRLSKDYERLPSVSESVVYIAIVLELFPRS
ncbi:transposase [Pleurocapsales cyanobacterium LEGE 06147]|nr:transposase [Pleurocapsales cyanobacterium LEGE 06147]